MSFGFTSIAHFFAAAYHDIVTGAKAVAIASNKAAGAETTIEGLTSLVSPEAAVVERAAFYLLGKVAAAAVDLETPTLTVSFVEEEVADIKAVLAAFPDLITAAKALKL